MRDTALRSLAWHWQNYLVVVRSVAVVVVVGKPAAAAAAFVGSSVASFAP